MKLLLVSLLLTLNTPVHNPTRPCEQWNFTADLIGAPQFRARGKLHTVVALARASAAE